jgi:S-adenosylmethionine-diacylgycerolhomoserine-N-methlytransferase
MTVPAAKRPDHAELMDSIYRGQRHVYDATRRYFLFGRDELIGAMNCRQGDAVLEIACGTGRNLEKIAARWPGTALFGLDISGEMLKSARTRLGAGAVLARGDATCFDGQELFGRRKFDRVVISYALSMIPEWRTAIRQALALLPPGGELHIVDFADLGGMPRLLSRMLEMWLNHFHVMPRTGLAEALRSEAAQQSWTVHSRFGAMRYFQRYVLVRDREPGFVTSPRARSG